MLLTKVACEGRQALTQDEEVLLVLLWERWSSFRDPSFRRALGDRVINAFSYMFGWIRGTLAVKPTSPDGDLPFFIRVGILASPHAYYGWKTTFRIERFFRFTNRALRSPAPPRRFVGVGYRDSGHRRDPAFDGSPSWQEVASQNRLDSRLTASHEAHLDAMNHLIQEGRSCSVTI